MDLGGSLPALRAGGLHERRKTQVRVSIVDRTCVFRLSRNPGAGPATTPAGAATPPRGYDVGGRLTIRVYPRASAATPVIRVIRAHPRRFRDACDPRASAAIS